MGSNQVGQTKAIPPSMHSSYKRLVNANPKARLSVGHFLEQGQRRGGFFDTPLIKLTDGVDNLGVKSAQEREAFLEYAITHCKIINHDMLTPVVILINLLTTFRRTSSK